LDPLFAQRAGFADVIVHGMFGMALLGRLVTEGLPGVTVLRFGARFRKPIQVDTLIVCTAHLSDRSQNRLTIRLEARDTAEVLLIEGSAVIDITASAGPWLALLD
jgi:acyl dehydratase